MNCLASISSCLLSFRVIECLFGIVSKLEPEPILVPFLTSSGYCPVRLTWDWLATSPGGDWSWGELSLRAFILGDSGSWFDTFIFDSFVCKFAREPFWVFESELKPDVCSSAIGRITAALVSSSRIRLLSAAAFYLALNDRISSVSAFFCWKKRFLYGAALRSKKSLIRRFFSFELSIAFFPVAPIASFSSLVINSIIFMIKLLVVGSVLYVIWFFTSSTVLPFDLFVLLPSLDARSEACSESDFMYVPSSLAFYLRNALRLAIAFFLSSSSRSSALSCTLFCQPRRPVCFLIWAA